MKTLENTRTALENTVRRAAIIAGAALLLMAVLAGVGEGYVRQSLIVPGNALLTATQVQGNAGMMRMGLLALGGVMLLDLLVTWAVYVFLRPFSQKGALTAAAFRGIYSVAFGIVQVKLWLGYHLLAVEGNISAADAAKAMDYFAAYETGWSASLIVFGLHLLALGWMGVRFHALPKWLGWVLVMAGIAYGADNAAKLLWAGYGDYKAIFTAVLALFGIVGEVGLALWFLIKGGRPKASR